MDESSVSAMADVACRAAPAVAGLHSRQAVGGKWEMEAG